MLPKNGRISVTGKWTSISGRIGCYIECGFYFLKSTSQINLLRLFILKLATTPDAPTAGESCAGATSDRARIPKPKIKPFSFGPEFGRDVAPGIRA